MAVQIQLRRDTAANWTSNDPTLAIGEVGFETDTYKLKIGDGSTAWTSLAYYSTQIFDVKSNGVSVGDGDIGTLDFSTEFTVSESPNQEINVSLNYSNISHTSIQDIGTNTHAQIDTHIADTTIHFTEGSIDHTAITNIGTNSHAQIDTHIASTSNPHSVTFTQAVTADSGTDISAAEAETLTDGSNADSLHTHAFAPNAFATFSPDAGDDVVADAVADTVTFTSTNGSIVITGTAASDTLNFEIASQFMSVDLDILAEQNVSVATTQTELKGGGTREATRVKFTVENQGSSTIYIGLTGVTISTGERLLPNESREYTVGDQAVYGIVASGTVTCHVKEYGPP